MGVQEKIEEIFISCSNPQGVVDFHSMARQFWAVLDNNASLCDLSGVFTIANPSDTDSLNLQAFIQFFNGISRIKYPLAPDHNERFLQDLQKPTNNAGRAFSRSFDRAMDKHVMKVLLKFDMPLRRAFSNFAGRDITVGGGVTWDEVRRMNIGMEVEGFVAFAGAHSLIPACFTMQQCSVLAKDVATQYPLNASKASNNSVLLYPQFQLLLCFTAIERQIAQSKDIFKNSKSLSSSVFNAKKTNSGNHMDTEHVADLLNDLLKTLGIDIGLSHTMKNSQNMSRSSRRDSAQFKPPSSAPNAHFPSASMTTSRDDVMAMDGVGGGGPPGNSLSSYEAMTMSNTNTTSIAAAALGGEHDYDGSFFGEVTLPASAHPMDHYSAASKADRQAMLVRMDRIFEDIAERLTQVGYTRIGSDPTLPLPSLNADPISLLVNSEESLQLDSHSKFATKPVVIGDAVPLPNNCPPAVEQLLESALAHHNLGSFQEALKFLEAARVQQEDFFKKDAETRRITYMTRKTEKAKERERAKALEEARAQSKGIKTATSTAASASKDRSSRTGSDADSELAVSTSMEVLTRAQEITNFDTRPPVDHEMYIILCKGNVYQSSGDDEQALLQYVCAWDRAIMRRSADWEVVCLNSIGLLCYFSLRYELAFKCFSEVAAFRAQNYSMESADTVTAINNEACCLYCLNKRGEARARFERAWNVMSKALGARHPRTIVTWRNLDKARRSLSSLKHMDLRENLSLRPDADKLLLGGDFNIRARMGPSIAPLKTKKVKGKKKK